MSIARLMQMAASRSGEVVGLVGYALTEVTSPASSVTVDLSGIDIQSGDTGILIAFFHSGNSIDFSYPNWTIDYSVSGRVLSGHRSFSGGETSFTVTGSGLDDGVAIISVYRGYTTSSADNSEAVTTSGMPNPPALSVSSGDKVFVAGVMDDDIVTMTAPTGYTLITSGNVGVSETGMSYGTAERDITSSGTEDPSAFGGAGSDIGVGFTYVLSPQ